MEVEIIDLARHDAILSYNNSVRNFQEQEWGLEIDKKQLEQEKLRSEPSLIMVDLHSTQIKGAEFRISVGKQRVESLKPSYDNVMELIKVKEKKLEKLKSKL